MVDLIHYLQIICPYIIRLDYYIKVDRVYELIVKAHNVFKHEEIISTPSSHITKIVLCI